MFDHATDQGRRIGIAFVMMQSKLTSPSIIDPTSNAPEVVVRVRCEIAPLCNPAHRWALGRGRQYLSLSDWKDFSVQR